MIDLHIAGLRHIKVINSLFLCPINLVFSAVVVDPLRFLQKYTVSLFVMDFCKENCRRAVSLMHNIGTCLLYLVS